MKTITIFLVILLSISSFATPDNVESTCENFDQPLNGGYCIHKPKTNSSNDIVYYLHGGGGSEFTWQENWYYTSQIRTEWNKKGVQVPTVVSISFGESWLLAKQNESPYSGLFEVFTSKVIPMIEQSLGGLKGRRIVFGESMGGFNSIQLSLKTALFDKAGILCSPMAELSPFGTKQEVQRHIEKSSAWQYYKSHDPNAVINSVDSIIQLTKAFYPTKEAWSSSDPMKLAINSTSLSTEMYVAVGFYDRFAAYEGNEIFVGYLMSNGFKVDWRPQWGGHCAVDIPSLATFLVN